MFKANILSAIAVKCSVWAHKFSTNYRKYLNTLNNVRSVIVNFDRASSDISANHKKYNLKKYIPTFLWFYNSIVLPSWVSKKRGIIVHFE